MNRPEHSHASGAKEIIQLRFGDDALELRFSSASGVEIALIPTLGLAEIEQGFFLNRVLRPLDAEGAIAHVEDELMPWVKRCSHAEQWHAEGEPVQELARWAGTSVEEGMGRPYLTTEAVESVFNRWVDLIEGRPVAQDGLPTSGRFSAALVLLREWMHHMGIGRLVLASSTQGNADQSVQTREQ